MVTSENHDPRLNAPPQGPPRAVPAPPDVVRELADACVRFVERAIGVTLDYTAETLPLLDHYLEQARATAKERPETLAVVAQSAGAYFGEVVRRRYPSWWRTEGDDPTYFQIELEQVYLAFSPVELMQDALTREERAAPRVLEAEPPPAKLAALAAVPPVKDARDDDEDDEEDATGGDAGAARLELADEDREAIAARLAELPQVSDQEFYAPSTRLEVIDIAVDAIQARRMGAGEEEMSLRPEDYDPA